MGFWHVGCVQRADLPSDVRSIDGWAELGDDARASLLPPERAGGASTVIVIDE